MLNNRKRFVISATIAAVLVLLAGGANALAQPTVRCVPSHTINPSCSATNYTHIQDAVTAASSGDIILVGPGTYLESVTISDSGGTRDGISLFGAQAGNDARVDRHDPRKESIVDGGGTGLAFYVEANYVVIDGFTVQGGTPIGINVDPGLLGPQVLNNILQNNSTGVYLQAGVQGATVERNLFKTNNLTPAPFGVGIVSSGYNLSPPVAGLVITENEFIGNKAAAMAVNYTTGATITRNTSEKDGAFVVLLYTTYSQISHNRGKNFGHGAGEPGWPADAAIDVGPGNLAVEIGYNELEDGKAPINNGIAFTTAFDPGYSHLLNVIGNKISRFPEYGIAAGDLPGGGTLYNSSILNNEVYDNGIDGIFIAGSLAFNQGIDLFDNDAEGNANKDCEDDTGPLNTWFNNIGKRSSPAGLCTPVTLHDQDYH